MGSTLKEIAKATGFSIITISRVINHPEKVHEATRLIIQEEIEKRGYHPNNIAKALVSNKTNIVFVYIPIDYNHNSPFYVQVLAGIGEGLGNRGYSMLLKHGWYANESCDGIILMGLTSQDEMRLTKLCENHHVVVFGHSEFANSIDVNNRYGAKAITALALSSGYTNLAYVSVDQDRKFVLDRLEGYKDAHREMNRRYKNDLIVSTSNNEIGGYQAGKNLLAMSVRPDAIICASDDIALGVMRAAREKGLEIPRDIGVTGFDGLGTERLSYPKITTVRQPIYEIGNKLANFIIDRIEKKASDAIQNHFYEPEIIINETLMERTHK